MTYSVLWTNFARLLFLPLAIVRSFPFSFFFFFFFVVKRSTRTRRGFSETVRSTILCLAKSLATYRSFVEENVAFANANVYDSLFRHARGPELQLGRRFDFASWNDFDFPLVAGRILARVDERNDGVESVSPLFVKGMSKRSGGRKTVVADRSTTSNDINRFVSYLSKMLCAVKCYLRKDTLSV